MGDKYYRIFISELKERPFQKEDELYRVCYLIVQDQFPDFDKKQYKTERGANMTMRRIKKYFPDIFLEMLAFRED